MCILKVEPGKKPYEKDISKDLDSIQAEVGGGFFQVVDLGGVLLYCNEEGKLNGMTPNRWLGNDIICGPFFLAGDDGLDNSVSLTDEQVAKYRERFLEPPQFTGREPQLNPWAMIFPM